MAFFREEDIGGLDVPVDDALSMEEFQHGAQLPDHLPELLPGQLRFPGCLSLYVFLNHRGGVLSDGDFV